MHHSVGTALQGLQRSHQTLLKVATSADLCYIRQITQGLAKHTQSYTSSQRSSSLVNGKAFFTHKRLVLVPLLLQFTMSSCTLPGHLTVQAAHITEVHNVPMRVLIRPIPSMLDESKVLSLMETIKVHPFYSLHP